MDWIIFLGLMSQLPSTSHVHICLKARYFWGSSCKLSRILTHLVILLSKPQLWWENKINYLDLQRRVLDVCCCCCQKQAILAPKKYNFLRDISHLLFFNHWSIQVYLKSKVLMIISAFISLTVINRLGTECTSHIIYIICGESLRTQKCFWPS